MSTQKIENNHDYLQNQEVDAKIEEFVIRNQEWQESEFESLDKLCNKLIQEKEKIENNYFNSNKSFKGPLSIDSDDQKMKIMVFMTDDPNSQNQSPIKKDFYIQQSLKKKEKTTISDLIPLFQKVTGIRNLVESIYQKLERCINQNLQAEDLSTLKQEAHYLINKFNPNYPVQEEAKTDSQIHFKNLQFIKVDKKIADFDHCTKAPYDNPSSFNFQLPQFLTLCQLKNEMQFIFNQDPQISEDASRKFQDVGPLKIDKKNGMIWLVQFDQMKYTLKHLQNIAIQINGYTYNFNYIGMVCNITNKPHGFGRAVRSNQSGFYDGQFKDGERHGYFRSIGYDGTYHQSEWKEGKHIRYL